LLTDLLAALDAPDWHGTSSNALYDSIVGGDINGLEPPYAVTIFNTKHFDTNMQAFVAEVVEVFDAAERSRIPVMLRIWP